MEAAAAPPRAIPASAMADSGVSTTAWPSEGRRGLQLRTGTGNAGESLDFEFCSFRLVGHDRPLKFGLGQSDRPKAFDAHEMRGKGGLNNRRNRKWIVAGFSTYRVEPRLAGCCIALLSNYVALAEIRRGSLVVPLPDFPVPDLWIKAMVPIDRLRMPRVNALLQFIRSNGGGIDSLDERSVRSTAKSRKK